MYVSFFQNVFFEAICQSNLTNIYWKASLNQEAQKLFGNDQTFSRCFILTVFSLICDFFPSLASTNKWEGHTMNNICSTSIYCILTCVGTIILILRI